MLPGCTALAQTKYLYRHNIALKILKYALLRTELKRQHAGFEIEQVSIVTDVLGGYSKGNIIGNHMISSAI